MNPLCSICNRRFPLESAKTDEHGLAVHEECYVLTLRLKLASSETLPEPRHRLSLVYSNGNRPTKGRSNPERIRSMTALIQRFWIEDEGQDIAEYAVMLAVILVLVVGTIRLVGSNANNAFSSVASSLQ
jgi:Flp pilus assembly pilin Flp